MNAVARLRANLALVLFCLACGVAGPVYTTMIIDLIHHLTICAAGGAA